MLAYLSKTISTLCRDIAVIHDDADLACVAASYDGCHRVRLRTTAKDARFSQLAYSARHSCFWCEPVFARRLPLPQENPKTATLASGELAPFELLGLRRELIKFYTSLVVLVLYSRRQIREGRRLAMAEAIKCQVAVIGSGPEWSGNRHDLGGEGLPMS